MNWEQVQGNWEKFKGDVKMKWGELTDNDLTVINGEREKLRGLLLERYGYAKDRAEKEIASFTAGLETDSDVDDVITDRRTKM